MGSGEVLLRVENLKKYFPLRAGVFKKVVGWVRAVDGVSFEVFSGETLGIVGESGCGKSTLGMTILRLLEPTGGRIVFDGQDITRLPTSRLRQIRKDMQMIFQDPFSSLNPRMTVQAILEEGLRVHRVVPRERMQEEVAGLLERVGLSRDYIRRFPHEFSGGQRQRISIARAIALRPRLVVADEALSSLDVSVRAQVLNLLQELKKEYSLTYLFISHDLAVVRQISHRILVMYLGKVVELAPKGEFFTRPLHPYSVALISAVPVPDPDVKRTRIILRGDVPSPLRPPSGCRFHTRCPKAQDICSEVEPPFREVELGHFVACHFPGCLRLEE
ncbi:MAG: ATP-binding cassette domain-containing protein [Candidatus Caldatribacterium sp.]|nr:ATP-binding cassette domain-containing protein [Candidatus Caldatribacterium sp.]